MLIFQYHTTFGKENFFFLAISPIIENRSRVLINIGIEIPNLKLHSLLVMYVIIK